MKYALFFIVAFAVGAQAQDQASKTISGPLAKRIYDILGYTAELEDEDEHTVEEYRKVKYRYDSEENIVALVVGNARNGQSFECSTPKDDGSSTCTSSHEEFPEASGGLSASLFYALQWGYDVETGTTGIQNQIVQEDQGYSIGDGTTQLTCTSKPKRGSLAVQVEQCKIVRAQPH